MLYVISSASFSYLASPYHSPGPNHKHPPPGVVSSGFEPTAPPTTPSPSQRCSCVGSVLAEGETEAQVNGEAVSVTAVGT